MKTLCAVLLLAAASPLFAENFAAVPTLPSVAAPMAASIVPAAPALPELSQAPQARVQLDAAIPQASAVPQSGESAKAAADAAFTGGKPSAPASDTPVVEPAQTLSGPALTPNTPRSTPPAPPAPSRFWTHFPAYSLGGSAAMVPVALTLHAVQQAIGTGSILPLAIAGLQLIYWGGIGLTVASGLWRGKIAKREHPMERAGIGFLVGVIGAGAVAVGLGMTMFSFYAG